MSSHEPIYRPLRASVGCQPPLLSIRRRDESRHRDEAGARSQSESLRAPERWSLGFPNGCTYVEAGSSLEGAAAPSDGARRGEAFGGDVQRDGVEARRLHGVDDHRAPTSAHSAVGAEATARVALGRRPGTVEAHRSHREVATAANGSTSEALTERAAVDVEPIHGRDQIAGQRHHLASSIAVDVRDASRALRNHVDDRGARRICVAASSTDDVVVVGERDTGVRLATTEPALLDWRAHDAAGVTALLSGVNPSINPRITAAVDTCVATGVHSSIGACVTCWPRVDHRRRHAGATHEQRHPQELSHGRGAYSVQTSAAQETA